MKYNKTKALMAAAAIAATAPLSVLAVIDMDVADNSLKYSSELKGTADAAGMIEVTKKGTDINVTGSADFSIATGGNATYYRFDLTGATFEGAISLAQEESKVADGADNGSTNAGVLQNVADQGSSAIFTVTTDANTTDVDLTDNWTLTLAKLDLDPSVTATIKYAMYADLANASNQTNALASKTANVASFVSGANYAGVVEPAAVQSTVASSFQKFGAGKISDTLDALGLLDVDDVVLDADGGGNATLKINGDTSATADYITAAQTITITGDVSVGVFTTNTNPDCASGTAKACTAAADNGSCTITSTATAVDQTVCLNLAAIEAGEAVPKGDYTIAFSEESQMDASLGSISYDTTTVEIPYITTYSGYNQRIFLDNRGTTNAGYTSTFTTENGVTAASGSAGTGTLTAGEMSVIKASDLVTLTGGTRGTATLEVEAQAAKLWVTTQIVDLGTGVTDTILLYPPTQSTSH
jgi:hypothetical protein